mmetsp:Transcript_24245/g.67223  ORF Transcript_24245/g.67223 Transcript_24245/m.67223 type:complete len:253 (+) Transcript_24245:898-1656(+)
MPTDWSTTESYTVLTKFCRQRISTPQRKEKVTPKARVMRKEKGMPREKEKAERKVIVTITTPEVPSHLKPTQILLHLRQNQQLPILQLLIGLLILDLAVSPKEKGLPRAKDRGKDQIGLVEKEQILLVVVAQILQLSRSLLISDLEVSPKVKEPLPKEKELLPLPLQKEKGSSTGTRARAIHRQITTKEKAMRRAKAMHQPRATHQARDMHQARDIHQARVMHQAREEVHEDLETSVGETSLIPYRHFAYII